MGSYRLVAACCRLNTLYYCSPVSSMQSELGHLIKECSHGWNYGAADWISAHSEAVIASGGRCNKHLILNLHHSEIFIFKCKKRNTLGLQKSILSIWSPLSYIFFLRIHVYTQSVHKYNKMTFVQQTGMCKLR